MHVLFNSAEEYAAEISKEWLLTTGGLMVGDVLRMTTIVKQQPVGHDVWLVAGYICKGMLVELREPIAYGQNGPLDDEQKVSLDAAKNTVLKAAERAKMDVRAGRYEL